MSVPLSSALRSVIAEYVALKRALGRQYDREEWTYRLLDSFLTRWGGEGQDLDATAFDAWCLSLQHLMPGSRRNRMRMVRNLCLYRRRFEPSCFVPDAELFPARHSELRPYIFTRRQIAQLIEATRHLTINARYPLRQHLFRIAIVLLYTTGLRLGELLRLTCTDYDPADGTVFVRLSKFHKSRLLPLSRDGRRELERYLGARKYHRLDPSTEEPLLLSEALLSKIIRRPASGPLKPGPEAA